MNGLRRIEATPDAAWAGRRRGPAAGGGYYVRRAGAIRGRDDAGGAGVDFVFPSSRPLARRLAGGYTAAAMRIALRNRHCTIGHFHDRM